MELLTNLLSIIITALVIFLIIIPIVVILGSFWIKYLANILEWLGF